MRVKMNIALRKRTRSLVRLVLEDSSKRIFMLLVVVVAVQEGAGPITKEFEFGS